MNPQYRNLSSHHYLRPVNDNLLFFLPNSYKTPIKYHIILNILQIIKYKNEYVSNKN